MTGTAEFILTIRGVAEGRAMRVGYIRVSTVDQMTTLLLSVMSACAEFERTLILERQREGIAAAKARGAYIGRKPALTDEQAQHLCDRAAAGEKKATLAKEFGVSRETVYSYLRAAAPTGAS